MRLIVGLGNPGEKYLHNRHNVGFMVVDKITLDKAVQWKFEEKFKAEVARLGDDILVKPQTFMNNSGESVSKIVNFYKIPVENVIVVHDDVDLPFGQVKMQKNAGSAGHKGVESVIYSLGSQNFTRVRLGVGRPENSEIEIEDWVLMNFSDEELIRIQGLILGLIPFLNLE